jgi:hypothetical protein
VYVPAVLTVILLPVDELLHNKLPEQPLAVKVAVSVPHKAVLLAVTVGAFGTLPTVITIGVEAGLAPQLLLHVAVYVPAVLTVILLPVDELLHDKLPAQPLAVKVAVSVPHKAVLLAVTVGAFGTLPTVITIGVEAGLAPQLLLHVAVYVPAVLTVILLPVDELLHDKLPAQPLAVKVAVSVPHKAVLLAVTVGAFGLLPVVIVTTFDTGLSPQLLLHTAL